MSENAQIIEFGDPILVTGATGFIGLRVVEQLAAMGFREIRCFCRPSSDLSKLRKIAETHKGSARIEFVEGNLLSKADCRKASAGARLIYHLAVGGGGKSFADLFMNCVLTTRNLLDACVENKCVKRFVNISSFSVYSNLDTSTTGALDESSAMDHPFDARCEAYCYAKAKQDQIVIRYGEKPGIPFVILRPGVVYGPGKKGLLGRIGLGTFGIFLHLGGLNRIPVTYIDNCADAIVLGGLRPGVEGQIFNIVDDDLPRSWEVLRRYKREVERFRSIYLPAPVSYALFFLWEKYSIWSKGQLPPTFNRRAWHAYWKGNRYTNAKLKRLLHWEPRVPTAEGLRRYFESCRKT